MEIIQLTLEMQVIMGVLLLTMVLFVTEWLRVDMTAVSIMVLLGLLSYFWGDISGNTDVILVPMEQLFSGFSSNAVMSIIAVMIIGAGLDKSGIMTQVAAKLLKVSGNTEKRVIPIISGTVAFISSFMQNIGAAALFLPVVNRISNSSGIPMSRLLMPMGFCAILGGTMTMIGSSPLILLNDLILTSNQSLPEGMEKMETFGLFDVSPIGILLVITGIAYFIIAGRWVLPSNKTLAEEGTDATDYLRKLYRVEGKEFEIFIPENSPMAGKQIDAFEHAADHAIRVIAACREGDNCIAPNHDMKLKGGSRAVFLGMPAQVKSFARENGLEVRPQLERFADVLVASKAGIAEIVIPPASDLIGKSLLEIRMRKAYGLNVLSVYRQSETYSEGDDLRSLELKAGDTIAVHTTWEDLAHCSTLDRDFTVITTNYPHEELRPHKIKHALGFFALALVLVLFTDMRLSLALFVGAVGMIASGVLTVDEAYRKVGWQSVFLLASLIPLGIAVESTNTAAWIAQQVLMLLDGVSIWVLQAAIAVLATVFTLLMSNVGATVLLVPLAVNIALGAGADPRIFALTVAIATSNSFLIPTHQVNALIMGPGGYKVKDFVKAGGVMTVLFLVVAITGLNLVF